MRTVDPIAPGAAAFDAAGGITTTEASSAKCEQCGEWNDGSPRELAQWARHHARDAHDARRPSVLGLDLSLTRAGIAVSSLDPARQQFWPSLLTHIGAAGSDDATWDERCERLVRQLRGVIGYVDSAIAAGADIRFAAIEGPAYGMAMMPSYYDRAGLHWSVYAALRARRIPIVIVNPMHRALFACGVKPPSGDAGKRLVLGETRIRWTGYLDNPNRFIANHDQADALGLCEMGVLGQKWPVPWDIRRRHIENVAAVGTWPAVTL
ncbi:hypothetical protein [Mycolicibacterium mucogenicum]|uniref:hypothetical protein n=1 Tax=Mycolicibacterium mucogenicum TaxID=56689 RepID=UPI00076A20DD|nr:hypothetical protein [Mycolicibacterium mucogenicum]